MIKYSKDKKITNEIIDAEISKVSTFVNNIKNLETTISSNINSLNKILENNLNDSNKTNEINGCLESSKINLNKIKHLIPSANDLQNTLNDMKKDVSKVKKTQVTKYNQTHQEITNSYSKINYTVNSCNNIISTYSSLISNAVDTVILKEEEKNDIDINNEDTITKTVELSEELSPITSTLTKSNQDEEEIKSEIEDKDIDKNENIDNKENIEEKQNSEITSENKPEEKNQNENIDTIPDALTIASFVDEQDSNLNELKSSINEDTKKKEKKSKKKTINIDENNIEEAKQKNKQKIDDILKKYKNRKDKKETKISSGRFDDIKKNLSKYINLDSIENFEITNKKTNEVNTEPKEKISFIEPISTFFQKKKEETPKDIFKDFEYKEKTLIISEKTGTVTLPYTMDELKEIYNKYPNKYRDLPDIIDDLYTRPLDNYKNVSLARFKEVFTLIREKEKDTLRKAFDLGLELFFNTNLHPAIISACKNLDELDIYLDYLETNEVHKFDFFKIVFEVSPVVVKKKKNMF